MKSIASLADRNRPVLQELAERLGYSFKDESLLQLALIHRSFAFEQGRENQRDNERLEFLGDAVLDLNISKAIYLRYPRMPEGEMTKLRSLLVKESHLALMARSVGLGESLALGRGEDDSRGRMKPSILSCAYEAVVGAIFLDGGYGAVEEFVLQHFSPHFDSLRGKIGLVDTKSRLQEILQGRFNEMPAYFVEKEEGPDHEKTFTVSVRFRELILAYGRAGSKKEAEQISAAAALEKLADGDFDPLDKAK